MREYTKPIMNVERFTTDLNFADSSCDYYAQVNVPCIITGSHNVFYDACGDDNYNDMTVVTVTSSITLSSKDVAIEYLSDLIDGTINGNYSSNPGFGPDGQGSSCTLAAGKYLIWSDGTLTHAGLVTPQVQSGINASA
ncbi:MAG: hypothetical protein LUH02_07715 [Erysipelotrichaceae bacterium]|nr:hypothetical protein [Erysipelotrichaceae bacterium]